MSALSRSGALLLVLSSVASADPTQNIELTVFDPTPTTTGSSFHVQTADVGTSGELVASALASYASKPLVLGTDTTDITVVRHHTKLQLGGAYAFGSRFEAGLRVPVYMQSGDGSTGVAPADGTALGDITAHAKARLVGSAASRVRVGLGLGVTAPTATDDQFAGTRLPSVRLLALVSTTPVRNVTLHVNAGGVIRETAQFANIEKGSGLAWGAGVSLRAFERVFFDLEAFGDVVPSASYGRPSGTNMMGEASMLTTLEGLAGARVVVTQQASLGVGIGRGLTAGIGEPELRGILTFAYAPSAKPLPPLRRAATPEVVDPNTNDADYDKLVDAKDKCPQQGEDKDGFEDDDGCPDLDNDGDTVADAKDKCPSAAEDKDSFADDDGCPDPDNDVDGVADATDKCPDKPEKINGSEDDDGCPDAGDSLVISNPDRLELLEPVLFDGDNIAGDSANVMNQLAATLRARADIGRLRIGVHVQPTKASKKDQALSDRRATAVREWLVKYGIAAERLDVKGFGSKSPLVKPETKGASMINNRVELIILERS